MNVTPFPLELRRVESPVPCPAWCSRHRAGHDWAFGLSEDPAERYHRAHVHDLADLSPWGLRLRLDQFETAHDAHGPTRLHPPSVVLMDSDAAVLELARPGQPLADELRNLAALLARAAMRLDTAPGGSW